MWLALLCNLVSAHPIAMRVADHQTRVEVDDGAIRVMYEVQFPVHTASDRLEVANADELVSGILVRVDDQSVPMSVVTSGERITQHDAFGWAELHGELPSATPKHIEVSLANYPSHPGIFRWEPWLHRHYVVTDSNLLIDKNGETRAYAEHPLHGDDWRTLTLDVEAEDPLDRAWQVLDPAPMPARPLADSLAKPLWAPLLGGAPGPILLLLGAPLAAVGGLAANEREQADNTVTGALFLLWLSVAWMHPSDHISTGIAMAVAVASGGAIVARPAHWRTVASCGLATAWATVLGVGAAGFFVWMAWATGRAASREDMGTTPLIAVSVVTLAVIALRTASILLS